ncbi:MAG TPA: hypothetical protein PKZ76_13200 [Xanthomonadaceae bacterium]|nr:hypothetical protein [Xanthomonadaceae bacterium]
MVIALLVAAAGVLGTTVMAATPTEAEGKGAPDLDVPRHVIAAGGGRSSGGAFSIRGTIGQADADPLQPSSGGAFAITGGFWGGIEPSAALPDGIFADGFEAPVN